ncbi:hypothetical protein GCM10022255_070630 [Dactylosporangium darangshiense]|uniref:Uncharacterized protein n=1 Tax=Dactylosporangium darangshiense TaxID=579108 RepID=A0ABP8DIA0_9ACTN
MACLPAKQIDLDRTVRFVNEEYLRAIKNGQPARSYEPMPETPLPVAPSER